MPTLYERAVSARTVRSRWADPHRHVSQCLISLALSSSCKYLAMTAGEIMSGAVGADGTLVIEASAKDGSSSKVIKMGLLR